MKQLEWLFVPTLAGYLFLILCNATRYRISRESGYHLFFKSAIAGIFLFVVAIVANIYLGTSDPGHKDINFMVFVLASIAPPLFNIFYRSGRAARRAAEKAGGLVELLLDEAFRKDLFVEVSLRSGKVYIGSVLEPGLGGDKSDIALIPLLSGYRDKDTQELEVTTRYGHFIRRAISELKLSLNYFRVVIPMSEVVSARIFDFDVATMMAEHQSARAAE